jgi:hypothetical protein
MCGGRYKGKKDGGVNPPLQSKRAGEPRTHTIKSDESRKNLW